MKYACIADIHGNMPALSAVLSDAARQGVQGYILLGDYCNSLPWVNEVVETLRRLPNAHAIKGNEEDYILRLRGRDPAGMGDGQFRAVYWTLDRLSDDNYGYIAAMPDRYRLDDRILCVHKSGDLFGGTSVDGLRCDDYAKRTGQGFLDNQAYFEGFKQLFASDAALLERLDSYPETVFLTAHNHMQYVYEINGKMIINPGSCGLPLDGRTSAPYTIIEPDGEGCRVWPRRVVYDVPATVDAFRASPLYTYAEAWSELIIQELTGAREQVVFFLSHAESTAAALGDPVRPFTMETWMHAYRSWPARGI